VPENYESGGQRFESLRARQHLAAIMQGVGIIAHVENQKVIATATEAPHGKRSRIHCRRL
jgi:hypothetical protein